MHATLPKMQVVAKVFICLVLVPSCYCLIPISSVNDKRVEIYRVMRSGKKESLAAYPSTSLDCPTCSRQHQNPLHVDASGSDLLLTAKELWVIRNGVVSQTLPLSSQYPSYLTIVNGAICVVFKPAAYDSWKPKCQLVAQEGDRFSLGYLIAPDGNVWPPSEYNNVLVGNGEGHDCFVYIADSMLYYVDMATFTPSVIDSPGCTNLTSVASLKPADDHKCRVSLACVQDGIRKRFIIDQTGLVKEIHVPLLCDSPLVEVPGGRYLLWFCASGENATSTTIIDLTVSLENWVTRDGIGAGDQLLLLPNGLVITIKWGKGLMVWDPADEYRSDRAYRRWLKNTASTSPRPQTVFGDSTVVSCSTDGTREWCQLFNVSSNVTTPVVVFDLELPPTAIIIEADDIAALNQTPETSTHTAQPSSTLSATRSSNVGTIVPIVVMVVVVVGGAVTVAGILVIVVLTRLYSKKKVLITPQPEEGDMPGTRTPGCGDSTLTLNLKSGPDGSSQLLPPPPAPLPTSTPVHELVTGSIGMS